MAWYEILAALKEYLLMAGVAQLIELGAIDPENLDLAPDTDGRYGAVFLVRGREEEEDIFHGGEGTVFFYAENWVRSDEPDPADGYKLLAEQELRCNGAITDFFHQDNPVPGIDITYAAITETTGDADSVRPRVGSRMSIKANWSKRTI